MSCTRLQCYVVPFGGGRPRKMNEDYEIGYIPGFGRIVYLPCGNCLACRRERRQELTLLQCCEASLHEDNWFLTLTYDDYICIEKEGLPPYSLNRDHLSSFLELMRKYAKYHGEEFRFFACGEYGGKTERPHYHLSIFGLSPALLGLGVDKALSKARRENLYNRGSSGWVGVETVDDNGNPYWQSPIVSARWPWGSHKLYRASRETYQYVAGYVTKKLTGERAKDFRRSGRVNEFQVQSRPSIGYPWFLKYESSLSNIGKETLVNDCLSIAGVTWKTPRIFDRWRSRMDQFDGPPCVERLKKFRTANVDPMPDRADLKRLDEFDLYSFDRRFNNRSKNEV